uniref:Uncharacterized protein n=1 Tax=viral metagenome TaxID=1070528 RepID=A0A6C0LQY8_9ZZZZ
MNKKYNIRQKLIDDSPHGFVNWVTISFLTPQNLDHCKYIGVRGFKVHNGYNTEELAGLDAKKIKMAKKEHDVFLSEIGKIYAWDDASKADIVEYDDSKLNDLEKTRKENIDKIKLMSEQFKNEYNTINANVVDERKEDTIRRLRQKMYDKGVITKQEYEMLQEEKTVKEVQNEAVIREKINVNVEEMAKIDYLDENEEVALKYGCMTIFSPKHIGGLKTFCFKVRGVYQTTKELKNRLNKLKKLYPDDRIYTFEIGKWCVYSDDDNMESESMLKRLNYGMKCHLDNLIKEKEEFDKRKEDLKSKAEQEAKLKEAENRKERRDERKKAKEIGKNNPIQNPNISSLEKLKEPIVTALNREDEISIKEIINYIDDPETHNKFKIDISDTIVSTVEI